MTGAAKKTKAKKPRAATKESTEAEVRREPSKEEAAAIADARRHYDELPVRAQMRKTVNDQGAHVIDSQHSDGGGHTAMLGSTFGSRCHPFIDSALHQVLSAAGTRGQAATEEQANAALAFIGAVAPANEMEASMAVQMFATNNLAMELLSRARHTSDRVATGEYTNMATKLSRTFVAQVEALAKLRRGGEQVVKYIHVHEGGQAVVAGTINQGGRSNGKGSEQPHANDRTALPCPDEAGNGVPLPPYVERAMQDARREEHGRSEG